MHTLISRAKAAYAFSRRFVAAAADKSQLTHAPDAVDAAAASVSRFALFGQSEREGRKGKREGESAREWQRVPARMASAVKLDKPRSLHA